ncbi:SAM-dependent methyltransferase [Kitasatospora sp. NPDC059646]|uniref:SAM-dependent methyltransferase n=1 Tax=Kitasatospora sp. NPDC059646 TaxID=3346893 RepID=UPI0036A8CA54
MGSGIRAIGQFTLESQEYLRWADRVFYCVSDPTTEQWILDQQPDAVDLYTLYDNDKPRRITYVQMAETMLRPLREGLNVVGVFYGHPGVFVNPSHRAIAIARQEGHAAFMLPAVSALDCLFSDLGIDPSRPGCQIIEATDLLLRKRQLLTDSHVVLLQVGSVGDTGFRFAGFPNTHLGALVAYLQDAYGPDHEIVNYIASQYAIADPVVHRVKLSELLEPENSRRVTGISTFYVPPVAERPMDLETAKALGLKVATQPQPEGALRSGSALAGPFAPFDEPYTEYDERFVALLDRHQVPRDYRKSRPSRAFYEAIRDLSVDPAKIEQYKDDPERALLSRTPLRADERTALRTGHAGRIREGFHRTEDEVAAGFALSLVTDVETAAEYTRLLVEASSAAEPAEAARQALAHWGYDTDVTAIGEAFTRLGTGRALWAGGYHLVVDGEPGRTLFVGGTRIELDGAELQGARLADGVLSWSEDAGNPSSGALEFALASAPQAGAADASYVGPYCHGRVWYGSARPAAENAFGKVGVFDPESVAARGAADPLSTWYGTYRTALVGDAGRWVDGPVVTVRADDGEGRGATVECDGKPVQRFGYADGVLGWTSAEPGWSGGVVFQKRPGQAFVGRLWNSAADPRMMKIRAIGSADGAPEQAALAELSPLLAWRAHATCVSLAGTAVELGRSLALAERSTAVDRARTALARTFRTPSTLARLAPTELKFVPTFTDLDVVDVDIDAVDVDTIDVNAIEVDIDADFIDVTIPVDIVDAAVVEVEFIAAVDSGEKELPEEEG